MNWMFLIGLVLVVFIAIPLVSVFRMSSIKLLPGSIEHINPAEFPAAQTELLISVEKFFLKQGFSRRLHVKRGPVVLGQPWGLYGAIYYHAETNTWVMLYVEPMKHPVFNWRALFITPTDQRYLVTESGGELESELSDLGYIVSNPRVYAPLKQWQSHQDLLQKYASYLPVQKSEDDILEALEVLYFKGLVLTNMVRPSGEGYRLPLAVSYKLWKEIRKTHIELLAQKKQYESEEPEICTTSSPESEYSAYQVFKKVQESNKASWLTKTGLLLGSVVLFGISFGLNFSIESLLILIAVLFVHELGHLFGMWIFGYRDLKMLFIPFMGALASGKKEKISAVQEAIILLLGPMPGYCLGLWLLFREDSGSPEWLGQLAIMSVILNGINLLPFMPLDGGRIINLALFNRLPKLQLVFMLFSIVALASIGFAWDEPIGLVIAAILFIGLPNLRKEIRLLQYMLKEQLHKASMNAEKVLHAIHGYAEWYDLPVQNKWPLLDSLSYRIQHANASIATTAFIFVSWVSVIVLPLTIALPPDTVKHLRAVFLDDYSVPTLDDFIEDYANAENDIDRIRLGFAVVSLATTQNPELGREYWLKTKTFINTSDIVDSERASYLARFAGTCSYFEEEGCEIAYLEKAIALYLKESGNELSVISLWIRLAQFTREEHDLALQYLDLADQQMALLAKDIEQVQWKTEINSNKAEIFVEKGDYAEAEKLLLGTFEMMPADNQYVLPYVQRRLLGLYLLSGQYEKAIEQYQRWLTNGLIYNGQLQALYENLHYMMVMLLVDTHPQEAKKLLEQVSTDGKVQDIEKKLAEELVQNSLGTKAADGGRAIVSVAKSVKPQEWFELASSMRAANFDQSKILIDEVLTNHWYGKMYSLLQQPKYQVLLNNIQQSNEEYFPFE